MTEVNTDRLSDEEFRQWEIYDVQKKMQEILAEMALADATIRENVASHLIHEAGCKEHARLRTQLTGLQSLLRSFQS